jgi:hypothetical protein
MTASEHTDLSPLLERLRELVDEHQFSVVPGIPVGGRVVDLSARMPFDKLCELIVATKPLRLYVVEGDKFQAFPNRALDRFGTDKELLRELRRMYKGTDGRKELRWRRGKDRATRILSLRERLNHAEAVQHGKVMHLAVAFVTDDDVLHYWSARTCWPQLEWIGNELSNLIFGLLPPDDEG